MKLLTLLALLAVSLSAEDKKPKPIAHDGVAMKDPVAALASDSQSAEVASLKAQITSLQAELKVLQMQFSLEMQVCSAPELMAAKLAAIQAKEAAKPKPPK